MGFLRSGRPTPVLDTLQRASVTEMTKEERMIGSVCLMGVYIMEVLPPVRVNELAAKFGLVARSSLGCLTGWDLADKNQQDMAWKRIEKDEPDVIAGSPPCTLCCLLQNINTAQIKDGAEWQAQFEGRLRGQRRMCHAAAGFIEDKWRMGKTSCTNTHGAHHRGDYLGLERRFEMPMFMW